MLAALMLAAHTPLLVMVAFPSEPARALVAPFLFVAAAAVALTARSSRRYFWPGTALLGALVFGAWVRGAFLPSAGSWDTEYWKAWTLRAVANGLTRVYGEAESVPPGHFWPQLQGVERRFEVTYDGRDFPVDYPPLAMALWSLSYRLVERHATDLDTAEIRNAAVKLPSVAGDVAALAVILWALRRRPRRAVALAALYWALPVSWLSSAALGYSDATYAPLSALALCAAGGGAAIVAGVALALACLIKPTAGVIAPAVLIALARRRGASWRALLAATSVGALALLPYLVAGTLATTVIHLYRIFHQRTLSGGFPNLWWLLGHLLTMNANDAGWRGPVRFASVDLIPEARIWGFLLFTLAAIIVLLRTRRLQVEAGATIQGSLLILTYGLLAVGVHENHPHALFLVLIATGLTTRMLRVVFTGLSLSYILTMLALSGIGRFYGTRYLLFDPLVTLVERLRMAPGIDLTLLLIPLNASLFILALMRTDVPQPLERKARN